MYIKVCVYMNEYSNIRYYKKFEILEKIPKNAIDIKNVKIDCEQGNDEIFDYDYFKILYLDNEEEICKKYIAIKK